MLRNLVSQGYTVIKQSLENENTVEPLLLQSDSNASEKNTSQNSNKRANMLKSLSQRYDIIAQSLADETNSETTSAECLSDIVKAAHHDAIIITDDTAEFRKLKEKMRSSNMITNEGFRQILPTLMDSRVKELGLTINEKDSAITYAKIEWTVKVRQLMSPIMKPFQNTDPGETSKVGEKIWIKKQIPVSSKTLGGRRRSTFVSRCA